MTASPSDIDADRMPVAGAPRPPRVALGVTGALLLAVGLVLGFTVTSIGARNTGELSLDVDIAGHRDGVLIALARFVNVGIGPVVAPILLVIGCAFLWRRSRFAAVSVVGLTIAGWLSVELGKALVHRARPPITTVHALVVETKPDSYPSGHTAFAAALVFAVAVTLILLGRPIRTVWWVGVPFIVLVAGSRLYLGAHYLTDVIASVIFAGGTVLVVLAILGPWLLRLRDHDATRAAG
ncbi:MAG: phosphatase PAP2 family protein [Humibacillus sp.]|nr:phosphatase PAP2 family protein [Humibacillus sp.]MDN5778039.1 phosphatase PAP2 family protein [Humibacillus sp.]